MHFKFKKKGNNLIRHRNLKKIMNLLGYKFITFTENLRVPLTINSMYNGYSWRDMDRGSKFPSLSVKYLLKKYYCYSKILDIAPLTKFLSVNIKFKKYEFVDGEISYKQIKIIYIFATPLVINNFSTVLETFTFLFRQRPFSWSLDSVQKHYPKFLSLVLPGSISVNTSVCRVYKFNGKFPSFSIFLNRLRYSVQLEYMCLPLIELCAFTKTPFYDCPSKSTLEGFSNFGVYGDDELEENVPFIPYLHLTLPSKFFLLSKFKTFPSLEPSNVLCSIIYNYMLLNNIYLSKDKQFIQIVQTHPIREKIVEVLSFSDNRIEKLANVQDLPIYNSILISGLPVSERVLGTSEWLLQNLIEIVTVVSRVLHMYIKFEEVLLLLVTYIHSSQIVNKLEYINSLPLLSRETLCSLKEYDVCSHTPGDGLGCGWFELVSYYILEKNPDLLQEYVGTPLVDYYLKYPSIRVQETLVSTNLFDTYVYSPCVR